MIGIILPLKQTNNRREKKKTMILVLSKIVRNFPSYEYFLGGGGLAQVIYYQSILSRRWTPKSDSQAGTDHGE